MTGALPLFTTTPTTTPTIVPSRRALLRTAARLAVAATAPFTALDAAAQPAISTATLRFGLAPFLTPAALMQSFRPWREHLERTLGQAVALYTAKDFRSQFEAMVAGEYDLAMMPAHIGAVAVADLGWQPVVRTLELIRVQLLVRDGGPVAAAADLRGRPVGMLDALALTATVGQRWLQQQGLLAAGGAQVQRLPSISSALIALQRDELAAVVAADSQLATLPPEAQRGVRALQLLSDVPGPLVLAGPQQPAAVVARWRVALAAFQPDPARPQGVANTRLTPFDAAQIASLAGYAEVARQRLAQPR